MKQTQRSTSLDPLALIHPNATGLDISSREIWVSVPSDRDPEPVRRFNTFTPDLERLVAWLVQCRVDALAMEGTGVYWIPVFELLEAAGLNAQLVEPRQLERVPGHKSDYLDCQWTQKLHSLGLLTASFRPDAEMRKLRSYLRHRAELLQHRAPHILPMQKALQQMNLQLHHVLSDMTGVTGLKIIRAIVAGEREPPKLAQFRNPGCKSSAETIVQALTGTWDAEHLFALQQSLELYDFYTLKVAECDTVLGKQFAAMKPRWEGEPPADLPPLKPDSHSKNQPSLRTRAELYRLTGVDVVAVHGISASLAQTILSETGTDVTKWPTEKHYCSWRGLAPHNDISGGKILRSRTLPTDNRAGQAFRQAAASVTRSQCAFGAYYYMLKHRVQYHDMGAKAYAQKQAERELAYLKKKAAKLGFTPVPREPASVAASV